MQFGDFKLCFHRVGVQPPRPGPVRVTVWWRLLQSVGSVCGAAGGGALVCRPPPATFTTPMSSSAGWHTGETRPAPHTDLGSGAGCPGNQAGHPNTLPPHHPTLAPPHCRQPHSPPQRNPVVSGWCVVVCWLAGHQVSAPVYAGTSR